MGHTLPMEETAPQSQPNKGMNKGLILVVFVAIVALAIFGYEATKKKDTSAAETATVPSGAPTAAKQEQATEGAAASTYKDGTYTVTGDYTVPGGPEKIEVKLTLVGDVITGAEVVSKAERPISKEKQAAFIGGYKDLVVGKNIDEVQLDKVSGSSLTPKGFNDAVKKIKEEARA